MIGDRAARSAESRTAWPVVVVSMPFMHIDGPSIQLGLLKAIGRAHGFPVRTLHANLDFAAMIGADYYRLLAEHRGRMIGDWLFSIEAFGDSAPDRDARFLAQFDAELAYLAGASEAARDRLTKTRERCVPEFLDGMVAGLPWRDIRVVGFSSTFQQNTASFALARRLKKEYPHILTVFGGANFDGEMGAEWIRTVDCIDFAVIGEGDVAFPGLLSALADGRDPAAVPGVTGRNFANPPASPQVRLDELPPPEYDEYFDRASALGLPTDDVWIPFESARGCWWGAKHHCTFCGLNGTAMQFRAKSPRRVHDELAQQARRYGNFRFAAVDNILDMTYLKELFPAISEGGEGYQIFYEVKSNLTRPQLRTLARGGVTHIQAGLESLSSHVLRLMDKGVSAAQNVNMLRWARYYGISVGWNILWGFPGETADDYTAQAAAVPQLVHLNPPECADQIWLERFSPLFTQEDRFRLRRRAPEPSYRHVYPATVDLDKAAYFFQYEPVDALPAAAYSALRSAVRAWSRRWQSEVPPTLVYRWAPGFLQILDQRWEERAGTYTFHDELADIYHACADRPTTARAVHAKLELGISITTVEDAFTRFQEHGLMFLDGSLAVALALPATPAQ